MGILAKLRHNAGEAFLQALDDVRHKVVEEGWTGSTQTPARQTDHQHSDPLAAMYGAGRNAVASWLHGNGPAGGSDLEAAATAGRAKLGERGIDAAYAAFVERCEASGIDPKDRNVSDFFWAGYADRGDDAIDWMGDRAPGVETPAIEPPGHERDQGLEL